MATSQLSQVIQHLREVLLRDGVPQTDGQLVGCFIEHRDEAAFAALIERHGAMVWGVCRRLLNQHEAEDAFQSTFLVLCRKAASIRRRELVGNWLYGVAHQTALHARRTAARRRAREKQVVEMPESTMPVPDRWTDLLPLLDEGLSRLPDHYRAVIVLCDLEGMTRKGAALQLGIPEGSVASRLARARAMLAKRLTQLGVTLSGMGVAAALAQQAAAASVPKSMVVATSKAASLLAAGQAATSGVISVKVAALTEGVMKAMVFTKLKSAIAFVLVLGLMAAGAASLAYRVMAAQDEGKLTTDSSSRRRAAGQDDTQLIAAKSGKRDSQPSSKDLGKIKPPGGVPLPIVKPGTNAIGVEELNKVRKRLEAVPEEDLERWVSQLERIMGTKLDDGLPSARQTCRTDFVIHLSLAFDDVKWNARAAEDILKRARTMPASEYEVWKEAFESVLKKKIGQTDTTVYAGGPAWAVPLVLIPVDALHDGDKYSAVLGKKYLARLKQLTADDVALWKTDVDKFGGTELDAAVNIILLDDYFDNETFQRDTFKAAIATWKGAPPKEKAP